MTKEIRNLNNGIECLYKKNANTPRMAMYLNFSINEPEVTSGVYALMARLLLQGTKKYSSEELAKEFEKYAIEFSCESSNNLVKFRIICLNEDFNKALELLNDVVLNSTFAEFEKEKTKLKYEITANLDSPRIVVMDGFNKTIFKDHYYGNSITKTLESIDNISKEDVVNAYKNILKNCKKVFVVVGALDKQEIMPVIDKYIGSLPASECDNFAITTPELHEKRNYEVIKPELNQAHIIKGWLVPAFNNKDFLPLLLLDVILGACGLSSRLFTELRDKKGLAYVVRSSYESFKLAGTFMIYIATEPKNIDISLKGFDEEIEKIKTIPVPEKELEDAKNNVIGKLAIDNETNIQQANRLAKLGVLGYGYDFDEKIKKEILDITSEQLLECAQKYFNDNYVISIVKP